MPRPIPCPDPALLRQMIEGGSTSKQIREHFGITYPVLYRWCRKYELPRPTSPVPYRNPLRTSQGRAWQSLNTAEKIAAAATPKRLKLFWAKISKDGPDGCWQWIGGTHKARGYGMFCFGGFNIVAHRVSWMLHYGPIPADTFVLHQCDNVLCVNPEHLFLGTNQDNYDDRDAKNRVAHGENAGGAKLKASDVIDIFRSDEPVEQLAKRYDVHPSHVVNIQLGRRWRRLVSNLSPG